MKKYLFALLMLCAAQAFAQELLDSAFFHEMEDSVSSLTIVPIEKPEALLKEIAGRLSEDMAQEPWPGRYKITETYGTPDPRPCTSECIVSAQCGLMLEEVEMEGPFTMKGPYRLTPKDSSLVRLCLPGFASMSPLLRHINSLTMSDNNSVLSAIKKMQEALDVTAFRISDAAGRSVYRINFSTGKGRITLDNSSLYSMKFSGVAYFDTGSLRLRQARTESYINTKSPYVFLASHDAPGLSFYPFYAKISSNDIHRHCRVTYEEVDGRLTVGKISTTMVKGERTVTEAIVERQP